MQEPFKPVLQVAFKIFFLIFLHRLFCISHGEKCIVNRNKRLCTCARFWALHRNLTWPLFRRRNSNQPPQSITVCKANCYYFPLRNQSHGLKLECLCFSLSGTLSQSIFRSHGMDDDGSRRSISSVKLDFRRPAGQPDNRPR